jgi:hypothetical protein
LDEQPALEELVVLAIAIAVFRIIPTVFNAPVLPV